MLINGLGGNSVRLARRSVHAFHTEDFKSGVGKITRENIVHLLIAVVGATDEFLDAQRAQRLGLGLPRGKDGNLVFGFPTADDFLLSLITSHHERRAALRMN